MSKFKPNENILLCDDVTEVFIQPVTDIRPISSQFLDISMRKFCLIRLRKESNGENPDLEWNPQELFELLDDGVKVRMLKKAEEIKQQLRGGK